MAIYDYQGNVISNDVGKLDVYQGTENSDKMLSVNANGNIEPNDNITASSLQEIKLVEVNSTVAEYGITGNVLAPARGHHTYFVHAETGLHYYVETTGLIYIAICGVAEELDFDNLPNSITTTVINKTTGLDGSKFDYDFDNASYKTLMVCVSTSPSPDVAVLMPEKVNLSDKFDKNVGFRNSGKYLYVGEEGDVTPKNIDFSEISGGASPEYGGVPVVVDTLGNFNVDRDTFYPLAYDAQAEWYSWSLLTYDQLIAQIYEPLRTAFPEYITREVIGRDQSDSYDIYAYTFEPDRYEQVIYLQSGVHPREAMAYITLARLMQKIVYANSADKEASYLRYNCKIVAVPVVNVWGVMKSRNSRNDYNSADVNLNTDVITLTQAENIAVTTFFSQVNTETPVSFAFDLHTTTDYNYGDYMGTFWSDCDNREIGLQTLWNLARKNCLKRSSAYLTKKELDPTELNIVYAGNSRASTTYAYWWKTLGISGSTVEHSDGVWSANYYDEKSAQMCLENFATQIINHAKMKFVKTYGGQVSKEWT